MIRWYSTPRAIIWVGYRPWPSISRSWDLGVDEI
jgi:hypothetical protein